MPPPPPTTTTTPPGIVQTWPRLLLRLEGATLLTCSLYAYHRTNLSWWLFGAGLLLPDIAMAGYLADSTVGAATYNALHTETPALIALCVGWGVGRGDVVAGGLVWLAHIGMDRMFGFGLKYAKGFGCTHLGLFGKEEEGKGRK